MHVFLFKNLFLFYTILHLTFKVALLLFAKTFSGSSRLLFYSTIGEYTSTDTIEECTFFNDAGLCQNGGTCAVEDGFPYCECVLPYYGYFCEEDSTGIRK